MARRLAATLTSMILFAGAANAGPSCDVIKGLDPMYADAALAFAELTPPAGCAKDWQPILRALRTGRFEPGVSFRDETYGVVVYETAADCTIDGEALEVGHTDIIPVNCEGHLSCVDDEAVTVKEPVCVAARRH
jgi:hypothetical protein